MAVFDQGSFGARWKQDRLRLDAKPDWSDDFMAGYKAALDRYISEGGKASLDNDKKE